LFNVRSEADFYAHLASALVKSTSGKWETWLDVAREFLSHLHPQISFAPDASEEISFDVEWSKVQQNPDDILDLPEKIAQSKHIKLVVCIDEFQGIADFNEPTAVQRKLRSHWQNHQNVSYCLYGSKRHMLLDIFSNPSMPFYRFGDIILLDKIPNDDWGSFIADRFKNTGKSIDAHDAMYLAALVDNHPYYVQQLAQQAWLRCSDACTRDIIDGAMDDLIDQLSLLFANTVDMLTNKQLALLHAIIDGVEALSSTDAILKYGLGTSGNVVQAKKALEQKEIIDIQNGHIEMLDPVFKHWLCRDFFKA
jgi:hypothetical protein